MGNTDENNILDGETLEKVIEKIRDFSAKDFTKFSAFVAVIFSISLWITRSMGYFYFLGRFSVYNIDKSYIDVWSNGFWIEVIRTILLCIVLVGINYIYYQLSIKKQRLKKVCFIFLEFIVLIGWIVWQDGIEIFEIFKDLSSGSIKSVVTFVITSASVVSTLNIYGIVFSVYYKLSAIKRKVIAKKKKLVKTKIEKKGSGIKEEQDSQDSSDSKPDNKRNKKYTYVIMSFLIACSIEFVVMYIMGISYEKQRSAFKFVAEEMELVEGDKYVISNEQNGKFYYAYAVIYENQDVYILSRIFQNEECWKIDTNILKVIDKKEVSTYYTDTIDIEIGY